MYKKKYFFKIADVVFFITIIFIGPFLYLYTRFNGFRLPFSRELLKKIGVYPIKDHFYEPLFKDSRLKKPLNQKRFLPGIKLREKKQLKFLEKLTFSDELINLEWDKPKNDNYDFYLGNGVFESGDAEFLYQIIRHFKPNKIIEIGSGFSTRIASKALKVNNVCNNAKHEHICIEPYLHPWLEKINITLIKNLVEECDLNIFKELNENDLLFIDSSHIIRPQGDVLFEYLEILPSLKKGVIVHIHDILTPRDYPDRWIRQGVKFWNEQYLLEALISDSDKYEVLASLNHLKHEYYPQLKKICPYLTKDREPGSFYIRKL